MKLPLMYEEERVVVRAVMGPGGRAQLDVK